MRMRDAGYWSHIFPTIFIDMIYISLQHNNNASQTTHLITFLAVVGMHQVGTNASTLRSSFCCVLLEVPYANSCCRRASFDRAARYRTVGKLLTCVFSQESLEEMQNDVYAPSPILGGITQQHCIVRFYLLGRNARRCRGSGPQTVKRMVGSFCWHHGQLHRVRYI